MRIVSLLPSATEIVCELGLGEELVGVTHECDHPPFVRALPKVEILAHALHPELHPLPAGLRAAERVDGLGLGRAATARVAAS